jgi:3-phenylpropionate/trans-cinnamate dioxygenase ferredoxin reductase subunit
MAIVIVGTGVAGISAARALREEGYEGEVRLLGAEPAWPYERPALSKRFLTQTEIGHPPELIGESEVREFGFCMELGVSVEKLDRDTRSIELSDGRRISYERLLLATGARPRPLQLPSVNCAGVHYLRDVADARALRAEISPGSRLVVVGGGVVGLEVAASASRGGATVTVVEAAGNVLGRVVPVELARAVEDLHASHGVRIRLGRRPADLVVTAGRVTGVGLEDGTELAADIVVVGIGVERRTEFAEAAGLRVADGILVDERFRTPGDDRIFAAGDVACIARGGDRLRTEQWRPAEEQGRAVAASLLGRGVPYRAVPWMWSDQFDLHLQATGYGFDGSTIVKRGSLADRRGVIYLGLRDGGVMAACGLSHGTGISREIRAARTLIGLAAPVGRKRLETATEIRRLANEAMATA